MVPGPGPGSTGPVGTYGSVLVVCLIAVQRWIENTDDVEIFLGADPVTIFGTHGIGDTRLQIPDLASVGVLHRTLTGRDVVGFPVVLVPQRDFDPVVQMNIGQSETESVYGGEKSERPHHTVAQHELASLGLEAFVCLDQHLALPRWRGS